MSKQYASSLLPSVVNPLARSFAENYVSARGISYASDLASGAPFSNIRTQFMGAPQSSRPLSSISVQTPQQNSSGRDSSIAIANIEQTPPSNQTNQITVATPQIASSSVRTQVPQQNSRTLTTPGVESASEAAEEVGSAGSAADAVAPELAIAQMAKDLGGGINSIWTNITNSGINSNYINTMTSGHGIGLSQEATNVAASSYANSSNSSLGGSIGAALGGPIGMLIGRGIAGLFNSPVQHAVAYSATGSFDPQSGSTPQSQSSWQSSQDVSSEEAPDS